MAYIPLELIPAGWGTGEAVFAAIFILGLRYRIFTSKFTMVELAGTALIFWCISRMTVLSIAEGGGTGINSLRDAMAIFAGLILFRIAKLPELREVILRGVALGLVLALGLEAYQLLIGLPTLRGNGYVPPLFNYDTASGAYRPFGGFFTPVIFGASIAMTLGLLIFSGRSKRTTLLVLAGVGGLILTYTRGAWIGLAVAVLVGVLMVSGKVRSRMALASIPIAYMGLFGVLLFPDALSEPIARLLTIGDSDYGSNSIRSDLWAGVIQVVQDKPLIGYGTASFAEVLNPVIGPLAQFGHAHNTFLMVLFQYGLIGLLLLAALLVTMFLSVVSLPANEYRYKASGIAVWITFVASSSTETTWGSFHLVVFLFLGIGLAFAPGEPTLPAKDAQPPSRQASFAATRPGLPRITTGRRLQSPRTGTDSQRFPPH